MAEFSSIKLNPGTHLLLDQPLLRLPYESSRNNFKSAQKQIEQTQPKIEESIKAALKSAASGTSNDGSKTVASLNQAITRLETLKRKLIALDENSTELVGHIEARTEHLQELYDIPTLADVKYDQWSKVRLDRLMVDYMLRKGYSKSAKELAEERGMEKLSDAAQFEVVNKIERSLRRGRKVDAALVWCSENKQSLKKLPDNQFERELRLQQFVELIRSKKLVDAITHGRKYLLTPNSNSHQWSALLCYQTETPIEPWAKYFSAARWDQLANMFLSTHHTLFSIPHQPLLQIALTAGLSALKTPACHSKFISPTSGLNSARTPPHADIHAHELSRHHSRSHSHPSANHHQNHAEAEVSAPVAALLNTPVCPICSTELNKLAEDLPFAHHGKSHVENDPVVLPNGRVYGSERLWKLNDKLVTPKGKVRDPSDPNLMYDADEVKKVYIM